MADDNDANLANGTPHWNLIVAAFAKHGIYLEGDASLTNAELQNSANGRGAYSNKHSPLVTSTTYLHDLTLYYRTNGTGAWNPVTLTASGTNFTGTIPAQTAGTAVEYYYVVHDHLNTPNAFFPYNMQSRTCLQISKRFPISSRWG